jgi:hypothetical protein
MHHGLEFGYVSLGACIDHDRLRLLIVFLFFFNGRKWIYFAQVFAGLRQFEVYKVFG